LREQASVKSKANGSGSSISQGDVVIVKNESTPRAFWRLARVEQLLPGKDGKIRSAVIKPGGGNASTTRRPIELLIPIEVKSSTPEIVSNKDEAAAEKDAAGDEPPEGRSRRTAAVVGEMKRRDGPMH
jgi:hypothetical protein